jgi:REP element-mobilizing transposase RayT
MDSNIIFPKRKQLRLNNYNYNSVGAYFITICTHERKCILSNIVGAIHESPEHKLSQYGKIVDKIIKNTSNYKNAQIDKYVIMPNHIHIIFAVYPFSAGASPRPTVIDAVCIFKSLTVRKCKTIDSEIQLFQTSFHDHVIRSQSSYERIWNYIDGNLQKWQEDCYFQEI